MDRVNWITGEMFCAIRQLSLRAEEAPDPDRVHRRMRGYLEALLCRGKRAGLAQEDVREMAYATAALADEVAMAHPGPLRDHWAPQPLQLLLFQENIAGQNFFVRLDAIRQDASRTDLLRVYYLCLLLGFRGCFGTDPRGDAELRELVNSLRTQLEQHLRMPEVLSPEGARPEQGLPAAARKLPWIALAATALVVTALVHVSIRWSLHEQARQVARQLRTHQGESP